MNPSKRIKPIAGLVVSAMLATGSHAAVTLSDFSAFALTGTYVQWDAGTFTTGATAFTVQANDFGGGFYNLPAPIDASGNDSISILMNVNAGNVANKFNLVLFDGDGTERVFRFDGITAGDNQTFTRNIADFLQDNNAGAVPGLDLANITAFHLQGTFENGDPGQAMDMTFDNLSIIPEPSSAILIAFGAFGLFARRRR